MVLPVFAGTTDIPQSSGVDFMAFVPLVLIFLVFYFLIILPQQKRMKAHGSMLHNIKRGDRVVTGGGFVGTVSKLVNDDELMIEIAENVKVRVKRATIAHVENATLEASQAPAKKSQKKTTQKPQNK